MPESPRWLVQRHRQKEALAVLQKIAKRNGRTISDEEIGLSAKVRLVFKVKQFRVKRKIKLNHS